MDFLYISPEFPPNYAHFIEHLDVLGVRVWGLGEADFYFMPESLRSALTWYVRTDLNDARAVQRGLDKLLAQKKASGHGGNFDLVESHNEQWLTLEGVINETYGIEGIKKPDLPRLKQKSVMKQIFENCGLPVARAERVVDINRSLDLADTLGYPLILKPDEGVGAGGICRVENKEMNYSIDDDLYRAYAQMIVTGRASVQPQKRYYCCYIGRKDKQYLHGHDEILSKFGDCLAEHDVNPLVYQQAMGIERYIFRSPHEADIFEMAEFVLKKALS